MVVVAVGVAVGVGVVVAVGVAVVVAVGVAEIIMEITYGVYEHLDAEIYHPHPFHSNSSLKYIYDGDPESYWALYVAEPDEKPAWARRRKEVTRAMELGTILHAWLLEYVKPFRAPFCVAILSTGKNKGECCGKTASFMVSGGGEWLCGMHAKGREVEPLPLGVSNEEFEDLSTARDRCMMDPAIRPYFETEGRVELSLFWHDEETGEDCRGRLDKLCEFTDGLEILDPKFGSADPNSQEAIGYKMLDMHYDTQSAMYVDGAEALIGQINKFNYLFISNGPPFDAYLWTVSENDIEMGRRHYRMAIEEVRNRRATNDWKTERFGQVSMTQLPKRAWDRVVTPQTERGFHFSEFDAFAGLGGT